MKLEEYMVARQQRKAAEALSTSHRARDVALTCVNSVRVQHCAEAVRAVVEVIEGHGWGSHTTAGVTW